MLEFVKVPNDGYPAGANGGNMTQAESDRYHSENALRDAFPNGSEIPMVVVGSSKSGQTRRVKVLAPTGSPLGVKRVSWEVAQVTGMRYDADTGAIVVRGSGYDATTHIAHAVARALYGDDDARLYGRAL